MKWNFLKLTKNTLEQRVKFAEFARALFEVSAKLSVKSAEESHWVVLIEKFLQR